MSYSDFPTPFHAVNCVCLLNLNRFSSQGHHHPSHPEPGMADVDHLLGAEDYSPIVIETLRAAIRYHYTFRGTKFKCRSPLDFTSDNDGMLVLRNIPTGPDDREAAVRVAVDDLKSALERLVQTSPTLSILSPTAQKVLIDEFCSETTVHLEAQTHHRHPYSPTTSNSAISLYTLIYALARETHGERTLDVWVKLNLERAMYSVSYILQSSETALSSLESSTNQFEVSTQPYVAPMPATLEEPGPSAPISTGSIAEEATASNTVSTALGPSTSSQVVDVLAESASSLPKELPKKRKNEDQPETNSQASKKAKTSTGALKRATSMVCRIPVARKSLAKSDKGKEVAPLPCDGEPAAPRMKGSRTAALLRKPFGPAPPLPQWL